MAYPMLQSRCLAIIPERASSQGTTQHRLERERMRHHSTPRRTIMRTRAVFPFTAIVGQESIKLALLLNAISPVIGGVLIRGHKGTAKSTAVRALSRLLPDIEVVAGCPFACALSDDPESCPHCAVRPAARQYMTRPAALVELP